MPVKQEKRSQMDYSQMFKDEKFSNLPHFTSDEVLLRNKPRCCWVIIFGLVRNLSPLVREYKGKPEVKTILEYAGEDISHWFDKSTGDIKYHIHPETGVRVPFTPFGKIPHVDTYLPSYKWKGLQTVPWWKDEQYIIGKVTQKQIPIRILNVLTNQYTYLNVCCEDTLKRIEERYSKFNSNTEQYVWKYSGAVLDMDKTLEENGISDHLDIFDACFIPQDYYVPCIYVYFKDEIY
ncbi:cytochrome b5 domain-containing protein 1 [Diaphorina citri]|jgi:Cytochrome b involved in lipid metabolism|uniref:Cytochrome b5 domain-containing protein 1 n=1 Tax=Diaphorina citri TaxID=121845 RepID=A0A1S3DBC9_DIACI|nr:cytochrome b5 domain-containing protein 1 [Diaphorina citri]KAI5730753.1 hypothetical protein M8J76_016996 [Diaphorina citri]KAI5734415.1 hypothetical protein M8J77_006342 [Diaphorina citri]